MTDAFDVEAILEQKVTSTKSERENSREGQRDVDSRRDKDRERDRSRDRSSRDRSRRRDDDNSNRDKDRDRRRRRSESKDKRRRRENSRSRSKDRSSRRDRDRERDRDRDRDREKRDRDRPTRERSPDRSKPAVSRAEETEDRRRQREIEELTKDQRTIFVSQLTKKVGESDLEHFFGQIGKVKSIIMLRDKFTGAHKGFAYVEMEDLENIPHCLLFNNVVPDFQKFPILVKASEAEKNFLAKKDPFSVKNDVAGPDTRIYVGNIHVSLDESALKAVVDQFGPTESIKLHRDHLGNSKGFAFVKYVKMESAQLAMAALPGIELMGRPLKVGPVTDNTRTNMSGDAASSSFGAVDPSMATANWKLDADEGGAGMVLNSHSRMLLMAKLGQSAGIQVPVPPAAVPMSMVGNGNSSGSTAIPPIGGSPSRAIKIVNMFDPTTETEPNWDEDIREDVAEECAKCGAVVSCYVEKHKAGGIVLVKMQAVDAATKAAQSLHGRFFAGRMITVSYIDDATYAQLSS